MRHGAGRSCGQRRGDGGDGYCRNRVTADERDGLSRQADRRDGQSGSTQSLRRVGDKDHVDDAGFSRSKGRHSARRVAGVGCDAEACRVWSSNRERGGVERYRGVIRVDDLYVLVRRCWSMVWDHTEVHRGRGESDLRDRTASTGELNRTGVNCAGFPPFAEEVVCRSVRVVGSATRSPTYGRGPCGNGVVAKERATAIISTGGENRRVGHGKRAPS